MNRSPRLCRKQNRGRGSILLAVMVVITIGALIGATVMYRFDAWRGGAAVGLEHDRLRALAWSGVQGAMTEIEGQRDHLLEGGAPIVTTEWELWDEEGARGIVRVLSVEAEGGKLDVNRAEQAMLCGLTPVGEDLAGRIVAARPSGGFDSAEAVGTLEGAGAAVMFGVEGDEPVSPALLSLLTAFGFEPNVQAGGEAAGRGEPRVHVSVGWSEEVKKLLAERLSAPALAAAEVALRGEPAPSDAELVRRMRGAGSPPLVWGEVLDVLCTGDDAYRRGRVDLSNAPVAVLACVPGLNAEGAARIVEKRSGLDARAKGNVAWPVVEGLVAPEAFESAADWLTTRTTVWRVRVEAVIETGEPDSPVVRGRMVWDAVIDACEETARVAYLRDVTYQTLVKAAEVEESDGTVAAEKAEDGGAEVVEDAGAAEVNEAAEVGAGPGLMDDSSAAERRTTQEEAQKAAQEQAQSDRRIGRWRGRLK